MSARYAIYLAPPPESALWRFGSRALGRDATTGEAVFGFAPQGFTPEAWREATAEPRRYGFHATLKAPFRLRDGISVDELEACVKRLAGEIPAFGLGALRASALKLGGGEFGFAALTPAAPSPRLAALEGRTLSVLDELRAPASAAEFARRRPERLTPRQREYLAVWGYPWVLEEFRLHFTLSGPIAAPESVAARLAVDFASEVSHPAFRVDALVLYVQQDGDEFLVRRRFPLG